ncbi:putative reverse transcriptase domain-containing protein [Tanacetum coccineum]
MTTAHIDGKVSSGSLHLCERCFTCHVGYCTIKCHKCGKVGHKARKVKQEKVREARSRAYAIKDAEPQGLNVVTGTFLLNNRYAFVLFDSGSDRIFMDTRLSFMLNIDPVKRGATYEVELAYGRIVSTNIILKGCTLNLVNHIFEIDLMPIELGTFDVIISMDWLVKHDAIIVCGEKVIPRKYVERGCHLFFGTRDEEEIEGEMIGRHAYWHRLDDAKYEHPGQDTRLQGEADLVDVVTIGIPSLSGDGFTKETIHVMTPYIVTTFNVVTPTVEKTNDGFQTVGKKKKRKGKSKSTNAGQFTSPSVKHNVIYEPKATTTAPKKGATYVGNTSQSSSMLKTTGNSSKKDNLSMSNSFSTLNDEVEDDAEDVEIMHDESANLNIKVGGSSSFMAAAG